MGNKSGSYQDMENVFSGFDEYLQIESIRRDYLVAAYTGVNVYDFLRFLISLLLTGSFIFFAVNVRIMNLYYLPVVFCAFGFWMMFRELLSICTSSATRGAGPAGWTCGWSPRLRCSRRARFRPKSGEIGPL